MKKDLKKEIFTYLEENQHLLDNVECNDILLKKFYPKVKQEEIKAKKKYISKVKNEFINRDNLLFDDKCDVIAKNIFTEPKKNKDVDGEKERYNIRILISAMEKLKKFAKKNNSNASAVIENLINQYL
ncbi:hypothetical protein KA977_15060 [Candidatus Dependentiae bacterium]|nr:hypothetical protein [Candidatus Dependentiae bacterium]